MTRLAEIYAYRKQDVERLKQECTLAEMARRADDAPPPLDFIAALTRFRRYGEQGPALIAEIKRASPSRGDLSPHLDPLDMARRYRSNGAAAISILTESRHFKGSLEDLRRVTSAGLGLPLLRKDFIFDPWQVYEARQAGADAVLLIVACLEANQLRELRDLIQNLKMAALIEVHTPAELEIALACKPALIGINNRNLATFDVNLDTTFRLRPLIPTGIVVVAESGIRSQQDAVAMRSVGVDAILVGEALVTAADISAGVRGLAGTGAV
jgi:indole-3-glycerol phosphate synthase